MDVDANTGGSSGASSPALRDAVSLPVTESSQVGEARRTATAMAEAIGFDETGRGQVALVVTEAANNLLRHATGGELVLRRLGEAESDDGTRAGIEVLAVDRGPGMANVPQAMRDGYSSGSTPGTGLGAIARLSAEFDIYSAPGTGTVVMSRLWSPARAAPQTSPSAAHHAALTLGVVCLPKRGEVACGDAWAIGYDGGRALVLVVDGLGHGLQASDAARQAVRVFRDGLRLAPGRVVEALHAGLRGTRGAAAAVAELRADRRTLTFVGVGNIAASVLPPPGDAADPNVGRGLVSHNGTLGAEARRFQEFPHPWAEGSLLIAHSDGLGSQWQLGKYPGLRTRHPALIAAALYRDFRRERDDVTVLVARAAGRKS